MKGKTIPILSALLVIAAFAIGVLWQKVSSLEKGSKPTSQIAGEIAPTNPPSPSGEVKSVDENDHIKGDNNAPLTWIEYSDLECPFCKKIHPDLQKLLSEYEGKVRWVYRHFPLDQLHSKARKEAEASECAAELGGNEAFWNYIDKIYEVTPSNNGLDEAKLPEIAFQVGLDRKGFEECLESGRWAQRVQSDYDSGVAAGVSGTPGNILLDDKGNTRLIPGALPYEQLKQAVEGML